MARSSLRQFSSAQRREGLSWSAALGLLLFALLLNAVGLYGTSRALAQALEPVPQGEEEEEVVEFDLVEPDDDDPRFVRQEQPNDQTPDDARRLADADSAVEHETQAPKQPPQPPGQPSKVSPKADESEAPKGQRDGGANGQEQGEHDGDGEGQDPGAGDDSLADAADGATASEGADAGAQQGRPEGVASLGGSPSMLNDTFGRPGSNDEIMRDVDEGISNVLETKRHVFASFFNRIRDQIADQWRPQRAHDAADPNHSKFGEKQRTTVLMVRLDSQGEIVKVIIERKSGAPHLDAEAVRAMKAAAPFPNPPKGLANDSGHIDFRFGFILDFNGGSKIFRYR